MRAVRKGDLKINRGGGLTDYIAEGELWRGRSYIPCTIGYNVYSSYDEEDNHILRAEYIFIQANGVTESGDHYEKRTIELRDNPYIEVADEEV